jgi:lysophospholipase L1-like esterase
VFASRRRRLVLLAAVGALAAAVVPVTTGLAAPSAPPASAGSYYLALGDSVAFGYRESSNLPTPDYSKSGQFRSYGRDVADALGLRLINAACPGETTTSLLTGAKSNGCEDSYDSGNQTFDQPGYRDAFPLHVKYTGTQMAFAKAFLKAHPATRLVTLTIGANDGFLCLRGYPANCSSDFGTFFSGLTSRVKKILAGLRGTGYTGQIVLLDYYSTNYADNATTVETSALDNAIDSAASSYHVTVASGFDIFKHAAAQASGNTCTAGLLTMLQDQTNGPCGVHPSLAGAGLLSQAVERNVAN